MKNDDVRRNGSSTFISVQKISTRSQTSKGKNNKGEEKIRANCPDAILDP